uniref:CBF1-interacting co-repressor CIR N-terminal domain-containing protein n=1 Tax=Aegilops tauschii subsp. strangulata TaxID=200361 RepID=A0A452YJ38_AEGTS
MGGHGGLNILPQKRWNVYRFDNQEKVRVDEAEAARQDQLQREATRRRESHARLVALRRNRGLQSDSPSPLPPGPRIRSPRRGLHPLPPGPRFHPPSPPTETTSTSSPAAVGPLTSPRLPPLAAGEAQLGRGSLRQTLSQTLRSVRRRRRLGRRGLTTRSTSWVMALPARAWLRPGTCRSLLLPPLRRGEITPKATGRRGVEGRRVSRSLGRRGGRGRPRRRSVSELCLPLQQGRRGSQTGATRRGSVIV